ncbi:hypothetical protein TRFO_10749 [Tritrichomonas foetus]|uniref:RRM domain-containing protein n=1 Tax=Tritrichomonas foetus TaxID=1144522 RepID=A0A1J4J7A2_9EUKA|nr:hypothetical protein TRFO_10749 [Tritrichomonas foetus]|eukprot:OHS95032.1 hypothetical protein TRFO_10749 [Tritrichomonas foetus]
MKILFMKFGLSIRKNFQCLSSHNFNVYRHGWTSKVFHITCPIFLMIEQLSPMVLAPYIKEFDESSSEVIGSLPRAVVKRLDNPSFTTEQNPDSVPMHLSLHLIPTNTNSQGGEASIQDQIAKHFDNQKWQQKVQKAMANDGLIRDKTQWVDDNITNINLRSSRDDYFSIRIDNLPENFGPHDLEDTLNSYGCSYFVRVVVPRDDQGEFKRFGFIKFERLRHALKCLEDCQRIMVGNMVLNIALVV